MEGMDILSKDNSLTTFLNFTYGRNQSGCEKAKKMGFLPFDLWVFLTIYIFVALMKITRCFKQLEASHIMSLDS